MVQTFSVYPPLRQPLRSLQNNSFHNVNEEKMEDKTDYARTQEEKHRRKVILPCVIPWECGSNRYASQKGQRGFGTIRNTTLSISSSKPLSESNDGVVPHLTCPPLHKKCATQQGEKAFGGFREQVTLVSNTASKEKIPIGKLVEDRFKSSERFHTKWNTPNSEAKNDTLYGRPRAVVQDPVGGRRFTHQEVQKSRAVIPRFADPRNTVAAIDRRPGEGGLVVGPSPRQATTEIEGLNRTEQDQLDSNRYMAWLGGQLTLQSQSRTGGFHRPRDVVSTQYYDRQQQAGQIDAKALRERLATEAAKAKEGGEAAIIIGRIEASYPDSDDEEPAVLK